MKHRFRQLAVFSTLFVLASFLPAKNGFPIINNNTDSTHYLYTGNHPDSLPLQAPKQAEKAIQNISKQAEAVKKIKPPDTKKAGNLFKKIAEFFKFKKKSRNNIISVVEQLGITDSIAATKKNIETLIDSLSKTQNQNFNTLLSIINKIKDGGNNQVDAISLSGTATSPESTDITGVDANIVTDKDIEDLANKLLPLIAAKAKEENTDQSKREMLAALRNFNYKQKGIIYLHKKDSSANSLSRYSLKLTTLANITGFYNYNFKTDYSNCKFAYLNTLIYDALFINGKTGNIKNLNGWDTSTIITTAQQAGCKIAFTAMIQTEQSVNAFLSSPAAQKNFIQNALFLLNSRKAQGININFQGLNTVNKANFIGFIKSLSLELKQKDTSNQLYITIPVYDNTDAYDLKELKTHVFQFIVDFSTIQQPEYPASLVPLKGKSPYSLESAISRYLNEDIPPGQISVNFPYRGAYWMMQPGGEPDQFKGYIPFSEIRKKEGWDLYYDEESASAVMDSLNRKKQLIREIWFEDETSLDKKYDFILQNKLGGIAVNALGFDAGYGELWDEMAYKFVKLDTVHLPDSIIHIKPFGELTLWDKIKRRLFIYDYMVQHPCEICFNTINNEATQYKIELYISELRIDSLMEVENKSLKHVKYHTDYAYLSHELRYSLGTATAIAAFLLLVTLIIYILGLRNLADQWKWKKWLEGILAIISVFLITFVFTYFFVNENFSLFGAVKPSFKEEDSGLIIHTNGKIFDLHHKQQAEINDSAAVNPENDSLKPKLGIAKHSIQKYIDTYCKPQNASACINMPLRTLLAIVAVCILIGGILTRYLILPLIKQTDIP